MAFQHRKIEAFYKAAAGEFDAAMEIAAKRKSS